MVYTLQKLQTDVMARLGEIARPQSQLPESAVPCPEDIVALRAASLLDDVGSRLIREASLETLGAGVPIEPEVMMRLMPCGLYGAILRLPEGFLRLTSVRMSGWRRSVSSIVFPESADWERQWSSETGIAGCPERPRAYIDSDREGRLLRLLGSVDSSDTLDKLGVWTVPSPGEDGGFDFPETLYAELVGTIAAKLS